MDKLTSSIVLESFVVRNKANEITSMDFAAFDALVSELVTKRATLRKESKDLVKAQKKEANAILSEAGKKYFDSLAEGAVFTYKDARGNEIELTKIKTKSGSGATASGEMVNPPAGAKSTKRYPKFYQLVVPTETAEDSAE